MKKTIYLDDLRTPTSGDWNVVRNYNEFVNIVTEIGLANIEIISLDHDLGDDAINEFVYNTMPNYTIDYSNISEKTGYDCAKWLVDYFYDENPTRLDMHASYKKQNTITFPKVVVHSANPIGSANIMGYINNFLMNERMPQTCIRVEIAHTVEPELNILKLEE
jgi:hypothetical protein